MSMKVRVLVADESTLVRRFMRDVVASAAALEFVGVAAHAEVALTKIALCDPDVVLIGVEMAEYGGGALLLAIRRKHPALSVLVLSRLTERAAAATFDALAHGATDWIVEPQAHFDRETALNHVRAELVAKVAAVCPKATSRAAVELAHVPFEPRAALPTPKRASASRIDCIVITAKCGGPNALAQIFAAFEQPLPVPIVVAQDMPPVFTRVLAERLNRHSNVRAIEAEHGMDLEAGTAYVAPGGRRALVHSRGPRREIVLEPLEAQTIEGLNTTPLETFLSSVGETFGAHVLTVVLTGGGIDGWRGCRGIRDAGGSVWIQDERSSAAWGLGRALVHAGVPERVIALADLGREIERRVRGPFESAPVQASRVSGMNVSNDSEPTDLSESASSVRANSSA